MGKVKRAVDKKKAARLALKVLVLTIAGIINAFGVVLVLAPVNLFDSGISGTAYLLDMVTPDFMVMSLFLIVLNVPFYLLALKKQGKSFVFTSIYAIVVYSVFTLLFRNVLPIDFSGGSPFTGDDLLLSAIFGGIISGVGSGLVMRMGGAIDGVEVLSVLFAKKLGMSVGTFIMVYNVLLYSVSAVIFENWTISLYSIIAYAMGVKTIDFIVEGLDKGKAVTVITNKHSSVYSVLTKELGRGVTVLEAVGGYSNKDKIYIYCVVNKFEITKVKQIVAETDPDAFVTMTEVTETIGGRDLSFSPTKRFRGMK